MKERGAALQHALCKNRHVQGCGKTASMAGDSAHDEGVFVIDLALNHAVAERLVIFGWGDERLPILRRAEGHARETERGKDLALAEAVERLAGEALQSFAQQDEADIAILGAGSRLGSERHLKGLLDQFIFIMGGLEELDISRQAGGVGQQHADSDLLSSRSSRLLTRTDEFGQQLVQWLIEVQRSAFIQDHAGGSDHNFGERGQIVNGIGCDAGGAQVISEPPHAFQRDQFAPMCDGHRGARTGGLVNGAAKQKKSTVKLLILMTERR